MDGNLIPCHIEYGIAGTVFLVPLLVADGELALQIFLGTCRSVRKDRIVRIVRFVDGSEGSVVLHVGAAVAGQVNGAVRIVIAVQALRIPLAILEHVASGVDVVVSAQDKIYVKLVHHLFEARVHVVLNVRVRRMLGHGLGGFVMRYDQPLILARVFADGCVHGGAEVVHHGLSLGVIFGCAGHTGVSCILLIIPSRISACVQGDEEHIVIEIIVVSLCLHLPALCKVILSLCVWSYAVRLGAVCDLIRRRLDIVAVALACAVVLSPERGLYLGERAVLIHACHRHLVGQIEVVLEHVMAVVVAHCRRISDGRHLLRGEEGGVLAGFAPALILHLVPGGYYKADAL